MIVHVPAHLHAASAASGSTFLLNARSGRWHVLNPAATAVWRELGRTGDLRHATDPAARRLVGELAARGLLAAGPGTPPPAPGRDRPAGHLPTSGTPPRPAAVVAFAVALLLLRLPFRVTVRVVRVLHGRCTRPASPAEAARAVAAADAAADRYPGRAACLERSLAAVVAAAAARRRVDWVLGAAEDPCRFHAWVEVDGVLVGRPPGTPEDVFLRVFSV